MYRITEQVVKYPEIILQKVWADLDRWGEFKIIYGDLFIVRPLQ